LATSVATAWVAPPTLITGQDHLGVRSPCEAIYIHLVPGITNVTDRARYYSFYPWLLWSMDRHVENKSKDSVLDTLRRAECLLTMIGIRHAKTSGEHVAEGDENAGGVHDLGLVGRRRLTRPALQKEGSIDIGPLASRDDAQSRYFANPQGGLGQYYFGPLRDLGLVAHDPASPIPFGWGKDLAPRIAEAFDRVVDGKRFFAALKAPTVSPEELDELSPFCPCALLGNQDERAALLDVFLARKDAFKRDGVERRRTLGLLLDIASKGGHAAGRSLPDLIRVGCYTGSLPGVGAWTPSGALENTSKAWGTYQRNELLSVALQGVFAAVLRCAEQHHQRAFRTPAEAGEFAVKLAGEQGLIDPAEPLQQAVQRVADAMPALSDWEAPLHELQLGWKVTEREANNARAVEAVFVPAVQLLLTLLARGVDHAAYTGLDIDAADPREVNLRSFAEHRDGLWRNMTAGEWMAWIATRWGLERHLTVALRKLRHEKRDTFQVRPGEEGFHVVGVPWPTFTGPRLRQSTQILRDLGLLAEHEGRLVATAAGQSEAEAIHAG
jgi:hypothetical protein